MHAVHHQLYSMTTQLCELFLDITDRPPHNTQLQNRGIHYLGGQVRLINETTSNSTPIIKGLALLGNGYRFGITE